MQEGHQDDGMGRPHQGGEQDGAERDGDELPPVAPQPPLISLTQEALQRMIEQAST
ncbi:UNVERIFIED_CONTAM: hypothetical protein Sradi_5713700 [Sesamum radiatum]|uniref:Uncharacterized protein n=1 Tax=Sesamum radiatum TaxID=300843 RepID=A0AAW2L2P7_SESRA